MVKIHIKKGTPLRHERFEGILNIEEDGTLKISMGGVHQMYIKFDKQEIKELLNQQKQT